MKFMNYKMGKLSAGKWLLMMKKSKAKWFLPILCIFLLSGCSLFPKEEQVLAPPLVKPAKIHYSTATAKMGTIVNTVDGVGNFTPIKTTDLSFDNPSGPIGKVLVKNGDHVKKGQVLIELDTGTLSTQIAEQKIELEKADLKVQQLQASNADKYSIEMAGLDKESAQLQLDQLNHELAEAQLTAPSDGVVTNLTNKKVGDSVQSYEPLVEIVDPNVLQFVYTALSADDLSDVALGMKATVTLNHGKKLSGKVVQLPGEKANGLPLSQDKLDRSILVQIDHLPSNVKMGDPADIHIVTQEKKNALIIPKQGLRTFMSETYVQVLDGNSKKQMDVKIGLQNDTEVEILKGIKAGDKVILQ